MEGFFAVFVTFVFIIKNKKGEKKMEKRRMNKKVIMSMIALAAVITVMAIGYQVLKPGVHEGAKNINIVVVSEDQSEKEYESKTDAQYLQQAMDEIEDLTYSGEEGDYGLMVDTINGETASYSGNGAYWSFFVNDEYCNYGISEQPIADGDIFKIVYTIGE